MFAFLWLFLMFSSVQVNGEIIGLSLPPSNNYSANCKTIFTCSQLTQSLSLLGVDNTILQLVQQSFCLGCDDSTFTVCCNSNIRQPNTPPLDDRVGVLNDDQEVTKPLSPEEKRNLLPTKTYCGLQHTDDRYYNDTSTALDELPWLAHVKFTDIEEEYKYGDRCSGVLISKRYVLTASACGINAVKVRLGQYSTGQKIACIENPHYSECSDGTIEVRVEKKVYLNPREMEVNRLALLRLNRNIDFSDYIRPICLPFENDLQPRRKTPFVFSGWGAKPTSVVIENAIKKRLVYEERSINICMHESPLIEVSLKTTNSTLGCYIPQRSNKDIACPGDQGGPLMYANTKRQWFVHAIVTSVLSGRTGPCSQGNPIISIKVTKQIIDLILEKIDP